MNIPCFLKDLPRIASEVVILKNVLIVHLFMPFGLTVGLRSDRSKSGVDFLIFFFLDLVDCWRDDICVTIESHEMFGRGH